MGCNASQELWNAVVTQEGKSKLLGLSTKKWYPPVTFSTNSDHGQRRTNEDKRRAVLRALSVPEWSGMSAREIAEWCGVSNNLVSEIKEQVSSDDNSDPPKKVKGKDGKSYPAKKPRKPKDPKTTRVSHLDQEVTATQDVEAAPQDGEGEATPGRQEAGKRQRPRTIPGRRVL